MNKIEYFYFFIGLLCGYILQLFKNPNQIVCILNNLIRYLIMIIILIIFLILIKYIFNIKCVNDRIEDFMDKYVYSYLKIDFE